MPVTYTVMVIGGLSLAGIFPLAGFWSKDEVLLGALDNGSTVGMIAFGLGLAAVIMTAFYMFRAVFMTFHGSWRGGADAEAAAAARSGAATPVQQPSVAAAATGAGAGHSAGAHDSGHGRVHLAESPLVMVLPMVVLAIASVLAGVLVNPPKSVGPIAQHAFGEYMADNEAVLPTHEAAVEAGAEPEFNVGIAIASTALALAGIGIAFALYGRGQPAVRLPSVLQPVHTLLIRKYYFDELYERVIVRHLFYRRLNAAIEWIDGNWIDGVNYRVSVWTGHAGRGLAQLQNGQVQAYGAAIFLGVIVTLAVYFLWGS
jgi:NADH-quinone oxidoreductase subunit L